MSAYKAPLNDMQFTLHDLLDSDAHYASLNSPESLTPDLLKAVLDNMAQFSEEVLAPLNQSGDDEGCEWSPEGVTTPAGFKEAYTQYVEGGWPGLAVDSAIGGQGLPPSIGFYADEMVGTSNWSWSMYPGLSRASVRLISEDGTDEQKRLYLGKIVEGTWTGTMCLTEAHCGSDVGLLKTKAAPNTDGSYSITGTKIFISAGEHDMAENIIHLVLARLPGAPDGTKGISLFIVPKFDVNEDGSLGERNAVQCGSIEKKMGINASVTAVLNFDGARGYLIGKENEGINSMFIMMNAARVGTAMQGLCMGEAALQSSVEYAQERLQMRALTGPKNPDGPADPIIVHPDVRRMLLTQKSLVEGSRAFLYWLIMQVDKDSYGDEEQRSDADIALALLTPVAKAFVTEVGLESANLGLQCFGGHGYIKEHGVEQIVRDARIATVYEGTTGIQALDFIGRKVLGTGGESLKSFTRVVNKYCKSQQDNAGVADMVTRLQELLEEWGELTMVIGAGAMENPDEAGAASVDYLMYSGYIVLAWFWLQMAEVSQRKLAAGEGDARLYTAKVQTAQFYFDRVLPRTLSHAASIRAGAASTMAMEAENFYLG